MRVKLIINRSGGSVRAIGHEQLRQNLCEAAAEAGLDAKIEFPAGAQIETALERAAGEDGIDAVVVGGGDGTVSSAARILSVAGATLAVLPLGTMNLYARSLGIPLDPIEAFRGLAEGEHLQGDLGEVNGRRFVHHVTFGIHPRVLRLRERARYGSRLGKMATGAVAWLRMLKRPPLERYELEADGAVQELRASGLMVSNNVLGEGFAHLPYSDHPEGGVLALYYSRSRTWGEVLQLSASAAAGHWQSNPHLEMLTGPTFELEPAKNRPIASIDGELERVTGRMHFEILPGALNILRPATMSGEVAVE